LREANLLSPEQLTEALRVQVMWGGRIGTVISELGYLDLDTISRALGWQHSLPAALGKHFDSADQELQQSFDSDLAECSHDFIANPQFGECRSGVGFVQFGGQ